MMVSSWNTSKADYGLSEYAKLTNTHGNANTHLHKDVAWSKLFHVCSGDFITVYLSGAHCLLDQADLPTHSHLSEHSPDEITHIGISFFVCMCFDVILIILREGRYLYLNAGLDKKQRWHCGFVWNIMFSYVYKLNRFIEHFLVASRLLTWSVK